MPNCFNWDNFRPSSHRMAPLTKQSDHVYTGYIISDGVVAAAVKFFKSYAKEPQEYLLSFLTEQLGNLMSKNLNQLT